MRKSTRFSPEIRSRATEHGDRRQDRQGDHLLAVVEDAVKLAVDEFLGRELGHQQQIERSRVALAGERGHALGVDQDQAQDRQADRNQAQRRTERVFELLAQIEEQPHAQGEEQDVAALDDQRLGPVGSRHELAPEDRVGPGVAIGLGFRPDPAVGPPGNMQPGGRPRLAVAAVRCAGRRRRDRNRLGTIGNGNPGLTRQRPMPPNPRATGSSAVSSPISTSVSTTSTSPSSRSSRGSLVPGFHFRSFHVPKATSAAAKVSRQPM